MNKHDQIDDETLAKIIDWESKQEHLIEGVQPQVGKDSNYITIVSTCRCGGVIKDRFSVSSNTTTRLSSTCKKFIS